MDLKEYFNLNLPMVTFVPDDLRWYNLETNRLINKPKNNHVFIKSPKICGSIEALSEFILINTINIDHVEFKNEDQKNLIKDFIGIQRKIRTLDDMTSGEVLPLTLFRLFVPARVRRVIDGDTIELFFDLKIFQLAYPHYIKRREGIKLIQLYIPPSRSKKYVKGKMGISNICRLYGIDTAEKNIASQKNKGVAATDYLSRIVEECNNEFYCFCMGPDKYRRILVILYRNKKCEKSINQELLEYRHPDFGSVANKYDGGTKNNFLVSDDDIEILDIISQDEHDKVKNKGHTNLSESQLRNNLQEENGCRCNIL